jgi:BON domain
MQQKKTERKKARELFHNSLEDATYRWVLATAVAAFLVGVYLLIRIEPTRQNWRETNPAVILSMLADLAALWLYTFHVSKGVDDGSREIGSAAVEIFTPDQLYSESIAMAEYALKSGRLKSGTPRAADLAYLDVATQLRDGATDSGDGDNGPVPWKGMRPHQRDVLIRRLSVVHDNFTRLVAPASPQTLLLLRQERNRRRAFPWLGSIRLVRMMIGLTIVLTPTFIGLAISVGTSLEKGGLFVGTPGHKAKTAVYLVVAAALGAAFAALSKAFNYIGNLSYDDKYESSYWIRFVQGIVAGVILSVLLSQVFFSGSGDTPTTGAANLVRAAQATKNDLTGFRITVPLLALVGGFSSDLVYRILERVIAGIDALIRGSISEREDSQEQTIRSELRLQELDARQTQLSKLVELKGQLPAGATAAAQAIDALIADLTGADLLVDVAADPTLKLVTNVLAALGVDDLDVTVANGVVSLSGTVSTDADRESMVKTLQTLPGVVTVDVAKVKP